MRRVALACLFLLLSVVAVAAQIGTTMPNAIVQFVDANGNPLAGGKLTTYAAGTSTLLATYSNSTLTTANANPVVLDSAGRATVYLSAATYKFVLTTSADVAVWTLDNVAATAPWNLDSLSGTVQYTSPTTLVLASNAVIPTGNVHALDTSGGAVNLNTITTTNTTSGFVLYLTGNNPGANPVTLKTGVDNLSLSGGDYTLDAVTKWISLVLRGSTWYELARSSSSSTLAIGLCSGRLTLTTGTPVTTADVTAATTVYWTPYNGNSCALYDGSASWTIRSFSETSIALGADAADTNYDVFAYDNSGTLAIERLAWTNNTTRATSLALQNGVLVKSGATTRRYVGTYRTTSVVGQTEDSVLLRLVWNYHNRVRRALRVTDATASWNYTTATVRQARNAATNWVQIVVGWAEALVDLTVIAHAENTDVGVDIVAGIGEDTMATIHANNIGRYVETPAVGAVVQIKGQLQKNPTVGYHFYGWLEYSEAVGTTTWYGSPGLLVSGLTGWIEG